MGQDEDYGRDLWNTGGDSCYNFSRCTNVFKMNTIGRSMTRTGFSNTDNEMGMQSFQKNDSDEVITDICADGNHRQ